VSTRTQTYKVADATKPPPDYADRTLIAQNTGGDVVVSYRVKRLGVDPALPSETASFRIDVAEPFAINTSPMILTLGAIRMRTATGGIPAYSYTSGNSGVATVNASSGLVTAKAPGQTKITASDTASGSASYDVEVSARLDFGADQLLNTGTYYVALGRPPTNPPANATYTRKATGGTEPYTYSSVNTLVATVDSEGTVRACGNGTTFIVVTDARHVKAMHRVTVNGITMFRNVTSGRWITDRKSNWYGAGDTCTDDGWLYPNRSQLLLLTDQYSGEAVPFTDFVGWAKQEPVGGAAGNAVYWAADHINVGGPLFHGGWIDMNTNAIGAAYHPNMYFVVEMSP